jgi:hypothetical protein
VDPGVPTVDPDVADGAAVRSAAVPGDVVVRSADVREPADEDEDDERPAEVDRGSVPRRVVSPSWVEASGAVAISGGTGVPGAASGVVCRPDAGVRPGLIDVTAEAPTPSFPPGAGATVETNTATAPAKTTSEPNAGATALTRDLARPPDGGRSSVMTCRFRTGTRGSRPHMDHCALLRFELPDADLMCLRDAPPLPVPPVAVVVGCPNDGRGSMGTPVSLTMGNRPRLEGSPLTTPHGRSRQPVSGSNRSVTARGAARCGTGRRSVVDVARLPADRAGQRLPPPIIGSSPSSRTPFSTPSVEVGAA